MPQTTECYTGSSSPGFTSEGTYDRAIWNGRNDVHTSPEDVVDLAQTCLRQSRESGRSRLVVRTRVEPEVSLRETRFLLHSAGFGECATYPDPGNGHAHITLAHNTEHRDVHPSDVLTIRRTVCRKMGRCLHWTASPEAFSSCALQEVAAMRERGHSISTQPSCEDLQTLWEHSFGWTPAQCQHYAQNQQNAAVFVLRDDEGNPLSGMLYYDGESTEWATVPEEQGKGYVVPLLIWGHSNLIKQGIRSVFTELRWNRSISPAIKSGFRIADLHDPGGILRNHVPIGDQQSGDEPDPWNSQLPVLPDGTDGRWLRSFTVGWLDPDLFTLELLEATDPPSTP